MVTEAEVKKLAALARIEVKESELKKFTREFDSIVAYVGQLEALKSSPVSDEKPALRNVLREDREPHPPGAYTKKLIEQFPSKKGDALLVKQVITHE